MVEEKITKHFFFGGFWLFFFPKSIILVQNREFFLLPKFLNFDLGCLAVIAKMNDAKLTRISDVFSANPPAMTEIADMLRNVSWDVERSILDEYKKSGEFDGHCEFYNALAKFMKDEAFLKRKEVLDVTFQSKMTSVLQADIKKQQDKAKSVATGGNIEEVDDVN